LQLTYHMRQQRVRDDEMYPDWMDSESEKHGILDWFIRYGADEEENQREILNG